MIKKIFLSFCLVLAACTKSSPPPHSKPLVLVSIAPYQFLVEQIGRDTIEVTSIVPSNANPHTFEPTAKEVAKIAQAQIWFRIGEPFEEKIAPFLKAQNPHLVVWDLREKIDLLTETGRCAHHDPKDHLDRHIWLSPKLASLQAEGIETILSTQLPEKKEFFQQNLKSLQSSLSDLDLKIASLLKPLKNRTLLVSHPAFGYFCKEYELKQLSVEYEGKDPRPRHLEEILQQMKTEKVNIALTLPQYNNKGTLLIAKKLDLFCFMIDPYSYDYMTTMNLLAQTIAR